MKSYMYTVLFEYFKEDDVEGYNVVVPALPGIVTWGKTIEEAEINAKEALHCHIEGLLKAGDPIPEDIEVAEPVRVARFPVTV